MALFSDRERARSFGSDADRYDRRRPSYPIELVDWLTDRAPGTAVDVGCGTGLLGRLVSARHWDVVGVEADARMAGVARCHGMSVEVSTFEEWDASDRRFDLLTCAQAWHWIDPSVGYHKAAELLRSGGRIALIWNAYEYGEHVARAFAEVLGRQEPALLLDSVVFGTASPDHQRIDTEAFGGLAELFEAPLIQIYEHERDLSVDEWLEELPTHSQIAVLPRRRREALVGELAAVLRRASPTGIHVRHPVRVTSALRR